MDQPVAKRQLAKKTKRFRLRGKWIFATYPAWSVEMPGLSSPQEFLSKLDGGADAGCPVGGIVAREQHADGTWHLHAILRYKSEIEVGDPRWADQNGKHANLQTVRSAKAVARYVTKEGDYLRWGEMDIPALTRAQIAQQIMAGRDLTEIVKQQPQLLFGYQRLRCDVTAYLADAQSGEERRRLDVWWLYGHSGAGKSTMAWTYWPEAYRTPLTGAWMDGYMQQRAVVFDDYTGAAFKYQELLRILDGFPLLMQTKGGMVAAAYTTVVLTSVKHPEDIYYNTYDLQLERRINHFVNFDIPQQVEAAKALLEQ